MTSSRASGGALGRDGHLRERGDNRVGEQLRVERFLRHEELVADAVQSPERMEVHDTTALELGDLHVRHAHQLACVPLGQPRLAGQLALDVRTRALEQPPALWFRSAHRS